MLTIILGFVIVIIFLNILLYKTNKLKNEQYKINKIMDIVWLSINELEEAELHKAEANEFIHDAINEKINYISQEPPEDTICPHCHGRCDYLDHNGIYQPCKECNETGIIKS